MLFPTSYKVPSFRLTYFSLMFNGCAEYEYLNNLLRGDENGVQFSTAGDVGNQPFSSDRTEPGSILRSPIGLIGYFCGYRSDVELRGVGENDTEPGETLESVRRSDFHFNS